MRIVSLVPAGTDIVRALGLDADLVGISHECDAPAGGASPPRLTRSLVPTESLSSAEIDSAVAERAASGAPLYALDTERLVALQPDLIVTQSLCDVCALPASAVDRVLADEFADAATISLDGRSIDGMLGSIQAIGARTGREHAARTLVLELRERLARVAAIVAGRRPTPVVCLEWLDPPYACGHWIPEMVERAGGLDLLGRPGIPSIPVSWSDIERVQPQLVVAMPCGYDLPRALDDIQQTAARAEWRRAIGDAVVYAAAGGAYFTRPGPRLVTGIEVLASVLHPEASEWSIPNDVVARWRPRSAAMA